MKVFTFFYNRFEDASTSIALYENGIDHSVLVHTEADLAKFQKNRVIKGEPVVTNNGRGLAYQRNSALDLMDTGEWAAFMCDDFKRVRSLPSNWILSDRNRLPIDFDNQEKFRLKRANNTTLKEMFKTFPKLIEIAESNKIHLIGFGLHDNPQNLKRKFTTRGLADGRFWLVKKSSYRFDENAQLIDDVAWTSENLVRHGNVLVLNWTVPYFKRYTAGGFGTTEERKDHRRRECAYLAKKYAPLVKIAHKKNWDWGTHIKIFGSKGNIMAVRKRRLCKN